MSFSGAQDGPKKAVQWLSMKFNFPHLLLPKVYQEIKDIIPARSQAEVPQIAEKLLRKVKLISALMNGDGDSLPADVTQVIFNALNLSLEEKKVVLPLLQDNRGVTIAVMLEYIADRFKTYEMIAAALGPGPITPTITANSATTQFSDIEDEDREKEDYEEQK